MDPRGMGQSSPLNCTQDLSRCSSDWSTTQEQYDTNKQCIREALEQCAADDPLIKYMDTISIAHDVEAVRPALNESKLNFFGASWGTQVGITYLESFPDRVDGMFLLGVLDQSISSFENMLEQRKASQTAFDGFAAWCNYNETCPLQDAQDIRAVASRASDLADGNASCLVNYMFQHLEDQNYPLIGRVRSAAADPIRAGNLEISRCEEGRKTALSHPAFLAITCHDYPTSDLTLADFTREEPLLESTAPTFVNDTAWQELHIACIGFPFARNRPHGLKLPSQGQFPRVLMMNSVFDLRRPVAGAGHVSKQIPWSVLVTTKKVGGGHTTYDRDRVGSVATAMVDAYFINGSMPKDGTVIDY